MFDFTKSLKGKLAFYFAVSIIISLLISGLISVSLVQRYIRDTTVSDLESQTESIAEQIEEEEELPDKAYQSNLERVQEVSLFIIPNEQLAQMEQTRPKLGPGRGNPVEPESIHLDFLDWDALKGGETIVEESTLPGGEMERIVVVHGYFLDGEMLGAVILSKPLNLLQPWRPIAGEFLIAAAIALAISLALAFLLARHLSNPLHQITEAATAVAEGDFSHEVSVQSEDEIGRLADAFRHMTTEVQKSQQQQREFVINVSHELKTPLTAITGHTQALKDGIAREPEEVAASLDVIAAETGRLSRLIDDLISLAKFDTRQFELRMGRVPLGELLSSLVEGFSRDAEERRVSLELDVETAPEIDTDPDRLRQVVANLVQNALFHTPPEGSVEVKATTVGGDVSIEVRDTGPGIEADALVHIFDRFYRSGEGTLDAGLGLGLPISRELARALGGDITVTSTVGQGSSFVVNLPA
jgi:signal transduction histidine kinase